MKASVVISVYNCEDIIDKTIPKILEQNFPIDKFEIIIVNDGSTDNSHDLLKKYNHHKNLKIINHKENRGRCASRNSGIKQAKGNIVIFLDCDIEIDKDFVLFHVSFHENENIIGLLSNVIPNVSKNKTKYNKFLSNKKRGAKLYGDQISLPYKYFIFTATSVKKFALDKTGLLNEELKGYGIDLHYSYRLWKNFPDNLFFESSIKVKQHKLKNFKIALNDFKDYGSNNLPIVLNSFPELHKDFGLSLFQNNTIISRILIKLIFNKFNSLLCDILIILLPSKLCNHFIKLRLLFELVDGYKQKTFNK